MKLPINVHHTRMLLVHNDAPIAQNRIQIHIPGALPSTQLHKNLYVFIKFLKKLYFVFMLQSENSCIPFLPSVPDNCREDQFSHCRGIGLLAELIAYKISFFREDAYQRMDPSLNLHNLHKYAE